MTTPRMGLLVPQYGATAADALATGAAADGAGLDVWVAGQLLPRPESDPQKTALEPLTLLGALSSVVTRRRLGVMAMAAPFLPAFYLAKALVTVDHLTGGRLDVGLGTGWNRREFAALGMVRRPGAVRIRELAATVDVLTQVSAGDPVAVPIAEETIAGETIPGVIGAGVTSRPAAVQQPRPPVWIAGSGDAILELAGSAGDWSNFARGIPVDGFRTLGRRVAEHARSAGRPGEVRLSLTATFLTGTEDEVDAALAERSARRGADPAAYRESLQAANVFLGPHDEVAAQLAAFAGAGCAAFVLWPLDGDGPRAAADLALVSAAAGW